MYRRLFGMLLHLFCPWLSGEDVSKHASYIADTVGEDLDGGLMLITTGIAESQYRKEIGRCECKANECDRGAALGIYQLHSFWWAHHTSEEICQSPRLQTRLAYKTLVSMRRAGDDLSPLHLFVGKLSNHDPRFRHRLRLYQELTFAAWVGWKSEVLMGAKEENSPQRYITGWSGQLRPMQILAGKCEVCTEDVYVDPLPINGKVYSGVVYRHHACLALPTPNNVEKIL